MNYDCIIIGGGMAGLQAAIQLGRYMHNTLVIDAEEGRSTICRSYHNILGYPDGVSGPYLREIGKKQAEGLGVEFFKGRVDHARTKGSNFEVEVSSGETFSGKRLLLATGVKDRIPPFPALKPCLGISVYVCPDCDGYEVKGKRALVMGSGNTGANMALTLTYFTNDLIYVNHEGKSVDESIMEKLHKNGIQYIDNKIEKVLADDSQFKGVELDNGKTVLAEHAFVGFGGNEVRSQLAKQLGIELLENKHILVDPRTKMTSVRNVWAAGDVNAHSEQVTIAIGEGMQAAIWIHKSILEEASK
jgi:thioredoxin reductase (NADPH)